MRILLVSLNYFPEQTGIGKYQGEMAAWLAAKGHDVRVITAPPYYPAWKISKGYSAWRYKTEIIDGVRVQRVPLYVPRKPTGLTRLIHLLSFAMSSAPLILWQALTWSPKVIVLTAPPLAAAAFILLAGKIARIRTHLHIQDFEVDAAFNLGLLKSPRAYNLALKIERGLLSAFSSISTISQNMRKKLLEKHLPEAKTFLVQNWANIQAFDPAAGPGTWREKLKLKSTTILALYSGNLGRKQGLETIIEAARLLQGTLDIIFVISGDGAGREDMERQAHGLSNVVFIPLQPLDDFVHLMIAADIHLLPQRAQAADLVMPSKLGNILASGRPVVAGAEVGTQVYDAIKDCGLSVAPEKGDAFAEAIRTLAQDPALRAKLGQNARARAAEQWGKESILLSLEKILQ